MKELIQIAAEEYIDKWNSGNNGQNIQIPYIPHRFDLKGKVAGQFWPRGKDSYFRWNLQLAEENSDDYLYQTVGHEVAHWITNKVYRKYGKVQSHGSEWKQIMRILGLEPKRCHNYTVTPAKTIPRPFTYLCPCGDIHRITATKFKNFVLRGLKPDGRTNYTCNKCSAYININEVKPVKGN